MFGQFDCQVVNYIIINRLGAFSKNGNARKWTGVFEFGRWRKAFEWPWQGKLFNSEVEELLRCCRRAWVFWPSVCTYLFPKIK